MNVEQVKKWIAAKEPAPVETAWLEAVAESAPAAEMAAVLEALVAAGQLDTAETLALTMLDDGTSAMEPAKVLEYVKAFTLAIVESDQLRTRAADLYKKIHGGHELFEAIFESAGLLGKQSPRRAFRTLDVCLGIVADSYLAHRYEGHVVKYRGFNKIMGQFEIADASGRTTRLEPKALADEYDLVDPRDFRVLCQHRVEELAKIIESDPAAVLIGVCMSRGGRIGADDLKEWLVPQHLGKDAWSGWWGRARTAAKRCPQLSLEGRSPIMINYHPAGLTLEAELLPVVQAAKTPREHQAALDQYIREAKGRKLPVDRAFAGKIINSLAEQAEQFKTRRPADALTAALALDEAIASGLPKPAKPYPAAVDILEAAAKPAQAVAELEDSGLWPAALDALAHRHDAHAQLVALLEMTPNGLLEQVTARLIAAGQGDVIGQAVAEAAMDPEHNLELIIWLWKGPSNVPANAPSRIELMTKMVKLVADLDRRWDVDNAYRKDLYQRIRTAIGASDFGIFRQAVATMDEHVAATTKRLIERTDGLADSVRSNSLEILRDAYPGLFYTKEKVAPWLDESAIWTTETALVRREAEYRDLVDVKMLANAQAIGAAAEHGDLSENSEWKFALEERDMLKQRQLKMEDELSRARIIRKEDIPPASVGIGSRVLLKRLGDGKEVEMAFLGPWDSDMENGIYSYQTRMGQDLMGKIVGDTVTLKMEDAEGEYRIERITPALE